MNPIEKSCMVASPKECNSATSTPQGATPDATPTQPVGLKALASKVLARNQPCNSDATRVQPGRNFHFGNDPQKLHGVSACHQVTQPTLPEWCNPSCGNYRRLEIPGLDVVQGCFQDFGETGWRWDHINKMKSCPIGKAGSVNIKERSGGAHGEV